MNEMNSVFEDVYLDQLFQVQEWRPLKLSANGGWMLTVEWGTILLLLYSLSGGWSAGLVGAGCAVQPLRNLSSPS